MAVESQGGEGPPEDRRVDDGVRYSCVHKGYEPRERSIEVVGPVERASTGTETALAVCRGDVAGQHGAVIHRRAIKLQSHSKRWVADTVRGSAARGGTRCPHKINWQSQIRTEVLVEVVAHT